MNHFGRIDILVNNAGIIQVGPVETATLEDFESALDVMFWGVLYPTLAVLPQMLKRKGGRIVNITSIGGKVSVPHLLPYTCAKFAAVGLSEGLRAELSKKGIKVVTIVPGLMRTGSYFNALFKGHQEEEFTWFSLGSSLPLISMDAQRAARQIVSAASVENPNVFLAYQLIGWRYSMAYFQVLQAICWDSLTACCQRPMDLKIPLLPVWRYINGYNHRF